MNDICIIGAGAWGTALSIHCARLGHDVALVARHPERIAPESQRQSPRLPGHKLPSNVRIVAAAPAAASVTLVAVPTQYLRDTLAASHPNAPLLLCCKGLEHSTGLLPLEIAAQAVPSHRAAILTGPNFAHEIAAGLPAAAVIAGPDTALRTTLLALLAGPTFRLYGNDDPIGAQLGGAAKNVVAVAAGAVIGAGLGENARAALITRGLAEIARLATALGGRADTVAGLSGLGDLVLTCTGPTSRNFSLGLGLGRGRTLADLLPPDGPVVEALGTAPAILTRAGTLDLPIIRAVADLLGSRVTLPEAIARLLSRPLKNE